MIKVGYQADLVVFAPDTIADCGTFHNPLVGPTGIHHVLVNGQLTVHNGEYTGARAGRVIRPAARRVKIADVSAVHDIVSGS